MNLIDLARRELAVASLNNVMEQSAVPVARRKIARQELRANLTDAAADVGMAEAIRRTGNLKELAASIGEPFANKPLWIRGLTWGLIGFGLAWTGVVWSSLTFLDGVLATGAVGEFSSKGVFPWFGTEFTVTTHAEQSGFEFGVNYAWHPFAIAAVVFIAAAKPWRVFKTS